MHIQKIKFGTVVLYPFTWLYRLVIGIRNTLFDWGLLPSVEFNLPVISVGNITVGGTGKTPHIEYLIELLREEFSIAVLSRGYRRETRNFIIADMNSTARIIGDEPRQLKQKYPEIIVAVDRKRVHGIRELQKLPQPPDLVLLDDAFQHRYVNAGKSVLLIDYNRMVGDDFLLPAGRLREPVSAMKRANLLLITKTPERLKPIEMRNIFKELNLEAYQNLFFTKIQYQEIKPVYQIQGSLTSSQFKQRDCHILLLSGIADPRPLRKFARSISTSITELTFPDHHRYTKHDVEKIREKIRSINHPEVLVLTTEKDAMRLQDVAMEEELKKTLYYVPIQVKFHGTQDEEFNKIILNYVRSNKRDNILHKDTDRVKA